MKAWIDIDCAPRTANFRRKFVNAIFAIVTVSKLNANTWDRGFLHRTRVVVVIRIRGNAFHSCCASIAAQEFLDGGGRLGFNPHARYCSGHSDHTTGRGPWHSRTKSQSGNGSRNGLSRLPFDRENDTESGNARVLPLIRPSAGTDPRPSRPRKERPQSREKNDHNIAELAEEERNEDTATAAVQTLPKALSTSTFHQRGNRRTLHLGLAPLRQRNRRRSNGQHEQCSRGAAGNVLHPSRTRSSRTHQSSDGMNSPRPHRRLCASGGRHQRYRQDRHPRRGTHRHPPHTVSDGPCAPEPPMPPCRKIWRCSPVSVTPSQPAPRPERFSGTIGVVLFVTDKGERS